MKKDSENTYKMRNEVDILELINDFLEKNGMCLKSHKITKGHCVRRLGSYKIIPLNYYIELEIEALGYERQI